MRRGARIRPVRALLALAGAVLVLLVAAQLALPPLAEHRISSKLARYGHVESVDVSAWPAVELLWGNADSVQVRATALTIGSTQIAKLLDEASGAERVDANVADVSVDSVHVSDAVLRKRGSRLQAEATMTHAQVAQALAGLNVALLSSGSGRVRVRVSGGLFGLAGGVEAVALASGGALVAQPAGPTLGAVRLQLFADPRIRIDGVSARQLDTTPPAYRLGLWGHLR
jgi:hypothetical protein